MQVDWRLNIDEIKNVQNPLYSINQEFFGPIWIHRNNETFYCVLKTNIFHFWHQQCNSDIPYCWSFETRVFIFGRLIAIDKQPGVRPVVVGEMWRRIFAKIVLKFIGPEATIAFQDDHMYAALKAVIDSAIRGVQAPWDETLTTENWGFLLVDAKNTFD